MIYAFPDLFSTQHNSSKKKQNFRKNDPNQTFRGGKHGKCIFRSSEFKTRKMKIHVKRHNRCIRPAKMLESIIYGEIFMRNFSCFSFCSQIILFNTLRLLTARRKISFKFSKLQLRICWNLKKPPMKLIRRDRVKFLSKNLQIVFLHRFNEFLRIFNPQQVLKNDVKFNLGFVCIKVFP